MKEDRKTISEVLRNNKVTFILGKIVITFFHNYFLDPIRYLRYLLIKLKLINNKRFQKLTSFKDLHNGERCFIVATGPSLRFEDLSLIKGEYSFSVNSIVKILNKTTWRPTYYGIQDSNVYAKIEKDIIKCGLETIFVGHRLQNQFISAKQFIPYFHFSCFHGKHGEFVPLTSWFSKDVSQIVFDGYSVTYSMLQIAVYMGFKEIYLLGNDCTYNLNGKQHFVESGFFDKQAASVGERMIYAYSKAKNYADLNGIKIYNATRGGMLEIFERVELENIVKSK